MVPERLIPFSQEPTNGPYSKPDESRPHLISYLFKTHFNIIF
jgi:hypothetical protein